MEIISGYTGKPHITSEQNRDVNIGIVGGKSYVLQTGMQMTAEISSNNEIKIRDGVLMHQGCTASIKKNTYDSLTIINGSQGMKRIDLIVARYKKDQNTGVENLDLKVIQGIPTESNPAVPSYTEGDIQSGDYIADMPLYEIVIDGLNITDVRKKFKTAPDFPSLIKRADNLIELLTSNAKVVQDCLTQTGESGIYKWYNATNQPCTGGYILVFKYNDQMSFRIAIGNSGIYASIYRNGTSYGSWVKICTYA